MGIRVRKRASASWTSDVTTGSGRISVGSGALDGVFSLGSRVTDADGPHTNPEELIGAGLAGCFAMSLANLLTESGHPPHELSVDASVHLEEIATGFAITSIALEAIGEVDSVSEDAFVALARQAKETCPVSRALAGTTITLDAGLRSGRP